MDFNNGLYVFNGVPGLESSKGERIAKALQKLHSKIKHLEQVRNTEKEESSKSGSTDIEDITLSDVRLKLLFLQLQYMRAKLRSTRYEEGGEVPAEHPHEQSVSEYCEIPSFCKETQTSLCEPTTVPDSVASHQKERNISQSTVPAKEATTSGTGAMNCRQQQSEHDPKAAPFHYHLNIDDVPFILGASAFDSHNLIANVQNLISKMKTHNKALCGSRVQASKNSANETVEKSCLHTKGIIKEISKDLSEIEKKQAKVIESFDNRNQVNYSLHQEPKVHQKLSEQPSNTGAAAAVRAKGNRKLKSKSPAKKSRHAVPVNKMRANLPQVARQRLLRSIKKFKMQLSEEDISWV